MAKDPAPQPWQVAASATKPPGSTAKAPAKTPAPPPSPGQLRQAENAAAAPAAVPVPTDAKGFQQYLKDHGANLGKTGPKKDGVDGIIGPKTLAEAQRLGITVPSNLAPAPTPAPTPATSQQQPGNTQQTPGTSQGTDTPAALPRLTADQIKAQYGYLGAILDFPDIVDLINQKAADPSMSDEVFLAKLKSGPTWLSKQTEETNFLALKPIDQQAQVGKRKDDLTAQAKAEGINIADDRLTQMATDSIRLGWDSTQIRNAIAAEFHYQPGGQTGTLGQAEQSIKKTASDYLVPLSDQTLAQWDANIASGIATPDQFTQYAISQAKLRFPNLSQHLDAGMTVQQLADPYRQTAAKELGVNPDSIDLTDAKWSRPLMQVDPKTGERTMMDDYTWQQTLRSDPTYGWDRSENGVAAGYALGNTLAQALGLRP